MQSAGGARVVTLFPCTCKQRHQRGLLEGLVMQTIRAQLWHITSKDNSSETRRADALGDDVPLSSLALALRIRL